MDFLGARKYPFGDRMAPGSVHEPGPALLGADLCSSGLQKARQASLRKASQGHCRSLIAAFVVIAEGLSLPSCVVIFEGLCLSGVMP